MVASVAEDKPGIIFTENERRLLQKVGNRHLKDTLREIGYGKIEIVVRNGQPEMVAVTKQEKLGED